MLYNSDDDGPPPPGIFPDADANNDVVDSRADLPDLAPLQISGWPQMPRGWKAELSVSDRTVIRIFDGVEVVGGMLPVARIGPPPLPDSYVIPDLSSDLTYGIEAVRFPADSAPSEVDIVLTIRDGEDQFRCQDQVRFRVAPWLMVWNGRPATQVYVCEVGGGVPWNILDPNSPDDGTAEFVASVRAALPAGIVEVIPDDYDRDRWVQDWFELGESHTPYQEFPVAMDSARAPGDDVFGLTFARAQQGADFGYDQQNDYLSSLDSFGNLEVSPPVVVSGLEYLFGRIYFGGGPRDGDLFGMRFDSEFADFLAAQRVQEPFEIDVGWLTVSHADEVVSFVPANVGRGFKMLIASPRLALLILLLMRRTRAGRATLFTDRVNGSGFPIETSVDDYLRNEFLGILYNLLVCQPRIDGVRATMMRELEVTANEIVEMPVLFEFDPATTRALAQTANVANVQVVVAGGANHVLVSKPFGPQVVLPAGAIDVFEFYVERVLSGLGNTVHFIDDWYSYHLLHGNVHCGTNVLRSQRDDVRWWQMEWVV